MNYAFSAVDFTGQFYDINENFHISTIPYPLSTRKKLYQ